VHAAAAARHGAGRAIPPFARVLASCEIRWRVPPRLRALRGESGSVRTRGAVNVAAREGAGRMLWHRGAEPAFRSGRARRTAASSATRRCHPQPTQAAPSLRRSPRRVRLPAAWGREGPAGRPPGAGPVWRSCRRRAAAPGWPPGSLPGVSRRGFPQSRCRARGGFGSQGGRRCAKGFPAYAGLPVSTAGGMPAFRAHRPVPHTNSLVTVVINNNSWHRRPLRAVC